MCDKETRKLSCEDCLRKFRRNDLAKHLQSLDNEFDRTASEHNEILQKLLNQKHDTENSPLVEEINQWERDTIEEIKQIAEQYRKRLINYTNNTMNQIENQLNSFATELKKIREENDFNEIDLKQCQEKLKRLEKQLRKPSNIVLERESRIPLVIFNDKDTKWKQVGLTVIGQHGEGDQLNQLNCAEFMCINDDQTLYIADYKNHRILEWKLNAINGRIVAGGNEFGNQMNQLKKPTHVIIDKENDSLIIADYKNRRVMQWSRQNYTANGEILISDIDCKSLAKDKDGSLYVSDPEKNEVKRWKKGEKEGTIVAGGNGEGDNLNQLNSPVYVFVDDDYTLYISDSDNHRVMKWKKNAKEGIVVAGGNGDGDNLNQLSIPHGIIVDQLGQIYVADCENDRVMCWCEGATEGRIVVGGNGKGKKPNQLGWPTDLVFDQEGNLYVADSENHRIQKFEIDYD